jgi:hypothetical protein
VTAEFAAVMPAVALVLVACLGGVQVAAQQVRLQDAAASAARVAARGAGGGAAAAVASRLVPGATTSIGSSGGLVCATVRAPATGVGPLAALELSASSCALGGGQ